MKIIPSRDVKVAGLLGPASPLEKKGVSVAETSVGLGGTTQWKLASLDASTTLAAFFEVTAARAPVDMTQAAEQFFMQFITKYLHESGESRCRVTTFTRRCDAPLSPKPRHGPKTPLCSSWSTCTSRVARGAGWPPSREVRCASEPDPDVQDLC